MDLQTYLDVAVDAAKSAGDVILDAWDKPRNVQHKGTADLVRSRAFVTVSTQRVSCTLDSHHRMIASDVTYCQQRQSWLVVINYRMCCITQSMWWVERRGRPHERRPNTSCGTMPILTRMMITNFAVQVTETDKECERVIVQHIKSSFPDHAFIGEEDSSVNGTSKLTSSPTWIIDPVDGTTNFVHKIPFICVCIGLAIDRKVCVASSLLLNANATMLRMKY